MGFVSDITKEVKKAMVIPDDCKTEWTKENIKKKIYVAVAGWGSILIGIMLGLYCAEQKSGIIGLLGLILFILGFRHRVMLHSWVKSGNKIDFFIGSVYFLLFFVCFIPSIIIFPFMVMALKTQSASALIAFIVVLVISLPISIYTTYRLLKALDIIGSKKKVGEGEKMQDIDK